MNRNYKIKIRSGVLDITTKKEDIQLQDAMDFASRENPKRAFLFVSKLLGKYIPSRPKAMREIYDRLAGLVFRAKGPVTIIGIAEVATGLGHGVHDSLMKKYGRADSLYIHTTRHPLNHPVAFNFEESHSHATKQVLHMPSDSHKEHFLGSKTLILVDDEITTGKTLTKIASKYISLNPNVEEIIYLTIASWLDDVLIKEAQAAAGREITVEALIQGRFEFRKNPDYCIPLPPDTEASVRGEPGRKDLGRLGIKKLSADDEATLKGLAGKITEERILVLGTGEFTFVPFLLAESLERQGKDVLFLSTARSPMIVGDGIRNKMNLMDHHREKVRNYLYNIPTRRKVIIGYEYEHLSRNHDLPYLFNARIFSPGPQPRTFTSILAAIIRNQKRFIRSKIYARPLIKKYPEVV